MVWLLDRYQELLDGQHTGWVLYISAGLFVAVNDYRHSFRARRSLRSRLFRLVFWVLMFLFWPVFIFIFTPPKDPDQQLPR
jgi:energy-coupling factor transporter transmembrane protein EcfT